MLSSNSSKKRTKQLDHSIDKQNTEYVRSFIGRIVGLKKTLRLFLTFRSIPTEEQKNPFADFRNKMKLSLLLCLHKNLFVRYTSGVFQDMAENIKVYKKKEDLAKRGVLD